MPSFPVVERGQSVSSGTPQKGYGIHVTQLDTDTEERSIAVYGFWDKLMTCFDLGRTQDHYH